MTLTTAMFAYFVLLALVAVDACTTSYPAQVLSLGAFKIQLPYSSNGSFIYGDAYEIKQTALNTFYNSSVFYVDCADGTGANYVVFRTPVDGVTTSGSQHSRTELREMANSTKPTVVAAWVSNDGNWHNMTIVDAITHIPAVGKKTTFGQVFKTDYGFFMEFQLTGTTLQVMYNSAYTTTTSSTAQALIEKDVAIAEKESAMLLGQQQNQKQPKSEISLAETSASSMIYTTLTTSYVLGTKFTFKICFYGTDAYYYLDDTLIAKLAKVSSDNLYFKAGNYQQSVSQVMGGTEATGEYSEVHMYSVTVVHGK